MIYLDFNATSPVTPEVRTAMDPFLRHAWGNPSSAYGFGAKLRSVVESAREQVADLVGSSQPREILFTSGGTEGNNTALHAASLANPDRRHIVTSLVEHSSVLAYCQFLEHRFAYRITYLPVDRDGVIAIADLEASLSDDTALVSLMWANNETGVILPIKEIAEICQERGVPFHCDAVQAVGKLPINVRSIPIDYLTITGHKIGASKGVGALYVRRGASFVPLIHGGHQEGSRRGGTENVPAIVGLGEASRFAVQHLTEYDQTARPLRDALERAVLDSIPDTELNGHLTLRLCNTSNITFHGVESEAMLLLLDQAGVCASSGSACLASSPDPSHVIAAMKTPLSARQCVRLSLGLSTTQEEVTQAVAALKDCAQGLRELSCR